MFIITIQNQFHENANQEIALAQAKYMKNKFAFYGIKSPLRRELQKPFFVSKYLPKKIELELIVKELWLKPQRELQYFTQELVKKYTNQFEKKDIELFEFMIVNKSWWDTIDFISVNLVGTYFQMYPEQIAIYTKKWLESGNIWLQRSILLFQLKYKQQLDTERLSYIINNSLDTKEFFIHKAIGWILREYGKTNPTWVLEFVAKTKLSNLSKREATRLLVK